MFIPKQYTKAKPKYASKSIKSKKLTYKQIRKYLIASSLILTGGWILIFRVVIPVLAVHIESENRAPILSPIYSGSSNITYSNANFQFEELNQQETFDLDERNDLPEYFYLSIPKLNIERAKVKTNADTLDPREFLGHYKGSCVPGEACNSFIYGHSTFSYVNNIYDKGDYSAIFSRLRELKYGDEFIIEYGEGKNKKTYRYIVDKTTISKPQDINPLANPYNKGAHVSSTTLFTCDPPGTTKNRLSIVGKLIN